MQQKALALLSLMGWVSLGVLVCVLAGVATMLSIVAKQDPGIRGRHAARLPRQAGVVRRSARSGNKFPQPAVD